jgi:hypothetical protein
MLSGRLAMDKSRLKSPQHETIRTALRVGGPLVAAVGLLFLLIGTVSFFSAFGSFGPPRYFWCALVGLPLLAVGVGMCKFGYLGDVARYIAAEAAPVANDTTNYLGDGVQPGVKAAAKAITEGVLEAQREHQADS